MGETGKIRYEGKPTADSVLGRRICVPPERLVVSVRLFTGPGGRIMIAIHDTNTDTVELVEAGNLFGMQQVLHALLPPPSRARTGKPGDGDATQNHGTHAHTKSLPNSDPSRGQGIDSRSPVIDRQRLHSPTKASDDVRIEAHRENHQQARC